MTMTNAEWCIKQGIKFEEIACIQIVCKNEFRYQIAIKGEIVDDIFSTLSILNFFKHWLDMEHVEPILTDKERKYIEDVCRPFKHKVKCISKMVVNHMDDSTDYYIVIRFFNERYAMFFPSFDGSAMYKGMEDNKWYTPMELGLYEDND